MLQVFAIASNALAVQSQKLNEIAAAVASAGATPAPATERPTPVRIGALPIGDSTEAMVSLKDVELAYKMNAAVIETAAEMFDSLLDAIDPDDRR
ncbi:flagellar basal body rod C-terminal domain-containing protein [uncultured Hyphomicrobium sp.]|uniref:flagellar basal body rod C-terminal domain-containing protein n=1 Tax=uncultured Hyphomicrobium sp. TaxID=194373 RepID=UPI0025F7DBA6|nr:flagellar basal body rod C-terminal domain-containing protein [uncultured Hyphomicrobium sp.]